MSQEREEKTVPVENDTTQDEKENIHFQMFRREAMKRMEEYNSPANKIGRNLLFGGE